jgi:hypothetical protein
MQAILTQLTGPAPLWLTALGATLAIMFGAGLTLWVQNGLASRRQTENEQRLARYVMGQAATAIAVDEAMSAAVKQHADTFVGAALAAPKTVGLTKEEFTSPSFWCATIASLIVNHPGARDQVGDVKGMFAGAASYRRTMLSAFAMKGKDVADLPYRAQAAYHAASMTSDVMAHTLDILPDAVSAAKDPEVLAKLFATFWHGRERLHGELVEMLDAFAEAGAVSKVEARAEVARRRAKCQADIMETMQQLQNVTNAMEKAKLWTADVHQPTAGGNQSP